MNLKHHIFSKRHYGYLLIIAFILSIACKKQGESPSSNQSIGDTETVNNLLQIENANSPNNPQLAIDYNEQAVELSKEIGYTEGHINGVLNLGRVYLSLNEFEKATNSFSQALDLAKEDDILGLTATSLGCLGMVNERESNYPESLDYYHKSKEAFIILNDSISLIKCSMNISNVYRVTGDRAKALSSILEALKIAELTKNKYYRGTCLNNLSILYQDIGENEIALPFFLEYAEICKEVGDSVSLAKAYNNIGASYIEMDKADLALEYHFQALELKEKLKNKSDVAGTQINIGRIKLHTRNYKSALVYFQKALKNAEADKNELLRSEVLSNMSDAYIGLEEYSSALDCLHQSLQITEEFGMSELKNNTLLALTALYSRTGDYRNAFRYSRSSNSFNDSLLQLRNNNAIQEIKTRYETEKKEQQIDSLNEEIRYSNLVKIFLSCLSVMLLILVVFIFYSWKSKIKRNKKIAEYQQSLIKRKLIISELEHKNLEQNFDHLERELVNMALYLMQKIEFGESLREEIKKMQNNPKSTNEEIVKKLTNLLNSNLRLDKEHSDFQLHLEKVNQLFYKKLEQQFPSITKNDMKLSALLRCDFTSKDISTIYGISPSSVDMNRYRLRKKFNLDSNENLSTFLKNL